ncbi:major intrinsic protein domain-containing protein [Phthorimaea operculella]|nr:major intrinsic protein domain-containing protein [Phthorimaea operculella]
MNPAVTLAALVYKQIPLLPAVAYIVAQHMNPAVTLAALVYKQIPLLPAVAYSGTGTYIQHMNPAVTLAALVYKQVPLLPAVAYIVAQNRAKKSWVGRWWRALVGEVLATALLMILGVGSLMPASQRVEHPLTHPALGFGFVVTALIVAFGNISGAHMNPAVTLAALVYKQIPLLPAVANEWHRYIHTAHEPRRHARRARLQADPAAARCSLHSGTGTYIQHMNPAVTLAALVYKQVPLLPAVAT